VTFIDKEGEKHHFQVAEGDNLLDIAQANDLEMEGKFNFRAIPEVVRTLSSSPSSLRLMLESIRCLRRIMCLLNLPCNRGGSRYVR
jgi:hypothetical protein